MVGREAELARIGRLLDDACAGRSDVLVLEGEPGVGKSALLEWAVRRATEPGVEPLGDGAPAPSSDRAAEWSVPRRSALRVLRARGVQSETHVPFAALADLLRPALFLLDRLPGPQAEAIQGALALIPSRAQDRFAVGSGALSLLAAYAEAGPVLVVVDDVQWIDGSSADALAFAFRRLVADPVGVLLGVRREEDNALTATGPDRVRLGGLGLAEATELLTAEVGPMAEPLLGRLHRDTAGNPLALLEVARQLDPDARLSPMDTPLPVRTSVSEIYVEKVRALRPASATAVLLAASSDIGDVALLARAMSGLGIDIGDLADAEDVRLVRVGDGKVEFAHPLIRAAVYHDASADGRRKAHRALADALPDREADRRAWHLALASLGPDPLASSALEQAGHRALERNAYEVAARAFERSSQLADDDASRARLLGHAARSAWDAGLPERAWELLDQAEGLAEDGTTDVGLTHLRGQIAIRRGPVAVGLAHLSDAAQASARVSPDAAVEILAEVVNAAFYAGDPHSMLRAADAVGSLRTGLSSERAAFFAALATGMAYTFSGRTGPGAEELRRATELAAGCGVSDDPEWCVWTALCSLWLRERGSARDLVERAVEVARSRTALGSLIFLQWCLAIDHAATDRWAEAEAGFHRAIVLARETGRRTDLCCALVRLSWLEARQGREAACLGHVDESLSIAAEIGLGLAEIWAHVAQGELHLARGRSAEAVEHFTALQQRLERAGIADADLNPAPELVELRIRLGDVAEAAELAAVYDREAVEKGLPWARARAARARGLVAPEENMTQAFEEALDAHRQTPDRFETARTQLAYGSRLRRARQRKAARVHLRGALETFELLGAVPWAAQARTELAATGETARARNVTTRNELTPQELQIALLLSAGRTTREAASALFLSPKTIEYHLRSVYRKLDCRNRDELAVALKDVRVAV